MRVHITLGLCVIGLSCGGFSQADVDQDQQMRQVVAEFDAQMKEMCSPPKPHNVGMCDDLRSQREAMAKLMADNNTPLPSPSRAPPPVIAPTAPSAQSGVASGPLNASTGQPCITASLLNGTNFNQPVKLVRVTNGCGADIKLSVVTRTGTGGQGGGYYNVTAGGFRSYELGDGEEYVGLKYWK